MTAAALSLDLDELRGLVVGDLELLTLPDFDQCVSASERRRIPLLRALAEACRSSAGEAAPSAMARALADGLAKAVLGLTTLDEATRAAA